MPSLAGPVSELLGRMRHDSVPMTLATLIINGVGEEVFFRDVARRALSDASSPSLIFQVALYIAVTAAMGVPLRLVASILIGGIAALEARRTDNPISTTALHLVWSIGMAFLLPVFIG